MWLRAAWDQMWPNMFAPSVFTVIGIIWSHIKRTRQADRHHAELKRHINAVMSQPAPETGREIPGPPSP